MVAAEPSFTEKFQAGGRQPSVNRKSSPLLAMKYAIGEISFLGVRFGMSSRPGTAKPRTTAEGAAKLAMNHVIGKTFLHVLRTHALGWWAARDHLLRSLSRVRAEGTKSRLAMKDSIGPKKR